MRINHSSKAAIGLGRRSAIKVPSQRETEKRRNCGGWIIKRWWSLGYPRVLLATRRPDIMVCMWRRRQHRPRCHWGRGAERVRTDEERVASGCHALTRCRMAKPRASNCRHPHRNFTTTGLYQHISPPRGAFSISVCFFARSTLFFAHIMPFASGGTKVDALSISRFYLGARVCVFWPQRDQGWKLNISWHLWD